MKAHLMHASRDVDLEQPLPPNAAALLQDLELDTVLDAMAGGDGYLRERAQATLLTGLDDPQAIRYRQRILADFLEQPTLARELYDLAGEALESKRNAHFFWFRDSPDALLQKSIAVLELLAGTLGRLRRLGEEHGEAVASEGLQRLFATVRRELDDEYLATLDRHLHDLRFRKGALISAELGRGNRGTNYVLRRANGQSLMERMTPLGPRSYSFTIPARDEHGHEALAALRNRGIRLAAAAVAQSADHVLGFFTTLRAEVAFYVGCLNLHERLGEKGLPACFPEPLEPATAGYAARGLYDLSLSFHLEHRAIGNDVDGDGVRLVVITGPNQGGKSTFLRSVGVAQLLLQAGSFVPAESFRASVRRGVFTHFKREEDAGMTSGKLDEELSRMSAIAEHIDPGDLLLCNESFSSTNEQEGSEIGRGLVRALTDAGVQVWLVTHLYDLAQSLYREESPAMSFLRAERRPDGTRTFRMLPGKPLPTSHGEDSYRRIFGAHGGDTASVAETA